MRQKQPINSYSTYRSYTPQWQYAPVPQSPVTPPVKQHPLRNGLLAIFSLAILAWMGYGWISKHLQAVSPKRLTGHAQAASQPTYSSPVPVLEPTINNLIAAHPELDIGVGIVDVKTGKLYHYGVSDPFVAASTAKLLTATLFLSKVEHGSDSLSESVGGLSAQTQLQKMIEDSDNNAWNAFNNGILGHSALQDYANSIGLAGYKADGNTITADDMARLLEKLYTKQLLNAEHTNLLLSYMKSANENDYIPAAVPSGVTVYHKAGWLSDRVHDAAVIDNGKRPYVLVIFSKARGTNATYNTTVGMQLFHDITHTANQAFSR